MTAVPYAWQLTKSLIYFIFNLLFRFIFICGYLSEVSPIKVSKGKKRRYFNFSKQNDDTLHGCICFSQEKHRLFNGTISDSSHSNFEIEHCRSSDDSNDVIVNDFSSVTKTELNFERKTLQSKICTTEQVINECALFDIVNVTGLVYNLQTQAKHEKDEKTLCIQKWMIKKETGIIEIILFSSWTKFQIIDLIISRKWESFEINWNYDGFKKCCCRYFCNWQRS